MARILVVDDEPDVRELFNITLKMAGHTTETAKDGVEAVERLSMNDIPDLILLDLMMPRLDGFGLLSHIREKMETKPVRVLVATAKVLEDSDQQKLEPWPVVGVLNKGELDIAAMVTIVSNALSTEPLKPAAAAIPQAGKPTVAEGLRLTETSKTDSSQIQPAPQPASSQPTTSRPTIPAIPVPPQPAPPQPASPGTQPSNPAGSQPSPPVPATIPAVAPAQPSVPVAPASQDTKSPDNSKPATAEERKPAESAPAAKETKNE